MKEIIAQREIFALSPQGEKKKFRIFLDKPYQVDNVSWACPIKIEGLYKELPDVIGHDSWQALGLAMGLVHQLLRNYQGDGGKLYWGEDGDEMSLNDLFPQLYIGTNRKK